MSYISLSPLLMIATISNLYKMNMAEKVNNIRVEIDRISPKNLFARLGLLAPIQLPIKLQVASESPSGSFQKLICIATQMVIVASSLTPRTPESKV